MNEAYPRPDVGMHRIPEDLSKARILVTNDDGINAPGLKVLRELAEKLSDDVWVVAPSHEQSAASHSLTLHDPLRIHQHEERAFAVDGTPTDCVLMAVAHILRDRRPDLVISGVNAGSNLADDVTYSGTIAAAMEATILRVPAVAMSLEYSPETDDQLFWDTPRKWGPEVMRRIATIDWPRNVLMSVNFPAVTAEEVTGVKATFQGERKLQENLYERFDPRGRPYYWIGPLRVKPDVAQGSDITAVVDSHAVSVSPLHLNLTDWETLDNLREVLD